MDRIFMPVRIVVILFGMVFLLNACSEDALDVIDSEDALDVIDYDFDTIEEAILAILADVDSLEGIDGLDDGGDVDIDYSSGGGLLKVSADTIRIIRIGRRIDSTSFERSVEIQGDSIAIVTSIGFVSGDLIIIVSTTTDTVSIDTFVKPFNFQTIRKIKLRRIGDGEIRRLNWRIIGITPLVGGSAPTTIDILSLEMISSGGDTILIDDPLNMYFSWTNLPAFEPGDTVYVYVTLTNESVFDQELVLLHHGARSRFNKGRKRLFDNGMNVDLVAGDNIYSGVFLARLVRGRMRHGFVDVIDWGTLFDAEGDINTKLLGVPYMIRKLP